MSIIAPNPNKIEASVLSFGFDQQELSDGEFDKSESGSTASEREEVPNKWQCPSFMFSTNSVFKSRWDLVIMILAIFNIITIPVDVSFKPDVF